MELERPAAESSSALRTGRHLGDDQVVGSVPADRPKPESTSRAEYLHVVGGAIEVLDVEPDRHPCRGEVAHDHRNPLVVGAHRKHPPAPAAPRTRGAPPVPPPPPPHPPPPRPSTPHPPP